MTNAFMASANKAKQEQRSIQTSHTDSDDLGHQHPHSG